MLQAELETSKKRFEQLSGIHSKCRSYKEKVSVGHHTSTDDKVSIYIKCFVHKSIQVGNNNT